MFDPSDYPDLLVGLEGPDDAAVWRLDDSRALVVTTDFFTPVVDTAYEYGAIAAANSLSDVYAMGGRPFLALNVAALPNQLSVDVSSEILRGGAEKAREAGVVIAGGHTVKDDEPKYGLVVIGFLDPRNMLSKGGLRVGDALVLTKPLGIGVTTTALKRGKASEADVHEAITWMARLNKSASDLAVEFGLRGGTDITGFGLIGHGMEMTNASGTSLYIDYAKIPFLNGASNYAEMGCLAGGVFDNLTYFEGQVKLERTLSEPEKMLLFDPQTSGGLLLGVPQDLLPEMLKRAEDISQPTWVIGEVRPGSGIEVG